MRWWTVEFVDALYEAGGVVLLHGAHDEAQPAHMSTLAFAFLEVAKLLALVFTSAAAATVIMKLFANELLLMRALRGDHTVICGLDFLGRHLVGELGKAGPGGAAGRRVVVIDKSAHGGETIGAAGGRAAVLAGNPTSDKMLRKAAIHRAARVIAATLDDAANIAVALRVIELGHEVPGYGPARPDVFIHVADPQVRLSLRRQRAFLTNGRTRRVSIFNVFENSARLLLRDQPLDYVRIREQDDRVVQLIIVGFGFMGEAVLTRAALSAHYANGKPLRAIVIDRNATTKEQIFYGRHRDFRQVCDAHFTQAEAEAKSTLEAIENACADPQTLTTVVICLDHDTRSLALGFSLIERLAPSVPICVRLNTESAVKPLVSNVASTSGESRRLTIFGSLHQACARDEFADSELDAVARALHKTYLDKDKERGSTAPADRSLRQWDQLDDDLVDSNRQLADHIPVKVRALGYRLVPQGGGDQGVLVQALREDERILLGKIEHQRWVAERLLAGWSWGEKKDAKARISPYLVPWERVPDSVKEYDLGFADILPDVVKLAKLEIRG